MPDEPVPPRKGLLRLVAENPWMVVVSLLIGIGGIGLTITFFLVEHKTRELTYYVNPTRTTIVKNGQSSDLHVLYKGNPVESDVTAIQVAIWNAGKDPIRADAILEPILLRTVPSVHILEARIRHVSRKTIQAESEDGKLNEGIVETRWRILEKNDGFVIQLIVAGTANVTATVSGIVEGQSGIKEVLPPEKTWRGRFPTLLAGAIIISVLANAASNQMGKITRIARLANRQRELVRIVTILAVVLSSAVLLVMVLAYAFAFPAPLPFD